MEKLQHNSPTSKVHNEVTISPDTPSTLTYVDAYGKIQKVSANSGYNENAKNVLGDHYLQKLGGYLWEGVWKTAASFVPEVKEGAALANVVGRVATKIALKTVGSAGNYYISGDYELGAAVKKGVIINAFTPSNYAPAFNSKMYENSKLGKSLQSYYKTLSKGNPLGLGGSGRVDYVSGHTPFGLKVFGEHHVHGNIYPLSFGFQAESKVFGYPAYNRISAALSHETNKVVHGSDVQFVKAELHSNQLGLHEAGGTTIPSTHLNSTGHEAAPNDAGSTHGSSNAGGHHDAPYEAAFFNGAINATSVLMHGGEGLSKYTAENTEYYSNKIDKNWKKNQDEINQSKTIVGKALGNIKQFGQGLADTFMYDVAFVNEIAYGDIVGGFLKGPSEVLTVADKFVATGWNGILAFANITKVKIANAVHESNEAQYKNSLRINKQFNEAKEVFVGYNSKGVKIYKKSLNDTSFTYTKPEIKTPQQLKKEAEDNKKAVDKLNAGIARLKAEQFEKMTGKKVGTAANPLPGQPFANNTPQMRNSVFNNQYNRNSNSYGRTTLSQAK